MSTAFLDLVGATIAALSTPTAVSAYIRRGRAIALPQVEPNGVFVRLSRADGDQPFAGTDVTDWSTDLIITAAQRAQNNEDGETAVDPLLRAVWQRLAAAAVPVGAEGWALLPVINWDVEEADQTLAAAELRLRVRHRTAAGDLTAAT